MFKLILFIMMCLSAVFIVVLDLSYKKEDSAILQRIYRLCLVVLVSGLLFQRCVLEWIVGYEVGGALAYPAGIGVNLLVCVGVACVVYSARWLWTGKWN